MKIITVEQSVVLLNNIGQSCSQTNNFTFLTFSISLMICLLFTQHQCLLGNTHAFATVDYQYCPGHARKLKKARREQRLRQQGMYRGSRQPSRGGSAMSGPAAIRRRADAVKQKAGSATSTLKAAETCCGTSIKVY